MWSKKNSRSLFKWYSSQFSKFLCEELETVFWDSEAKFQKLFKPNFSHRKHLENCFDAILRPESYVLILWKLYFSVLLKFLSDVVETVFWESEVKHWELFKSKIGNSKDFRKWFWMALVLKSFEMTLYTFLQILERRNWKYFLKKWGKASKTVQTKFYS